MPHFLSIVFESKHQLLKSAWSDSHFEDCGFKSNARLGVASYEGQQSSEYYLVHRVDEASTVFSACILETSITAFRAKLRQVLSPNELSMIHCGYEGVGAPPVPKYMYFDGLQPPMLGNFIYSPSKRHSWQVYLWTLCSQRYALRNLYPSNIFRTSSLEAFLKDANVLKCLDQGDLAIQELAPDVSRLLLKRSKVSELFSAAVSTGAVVEEMPFAQKYFLDDGFIDSLL